MNNKKVKVPARVKALLKEREALEAKLAAIKTKLTEKTKYVIYYYTDVYHTQLCRKTVKAADEKEAVKKFYAWQEADLRFGGQGCGGYYKPYRVEVAY